MVLEIARARAIVPATRGIAAVLEIAGVQAIVRAVLGIAEAAEVGGVRAIELPIWIAEAVAAAAWVEAAETASATEMFREAAVVNGAAAPLVAADPLVVVPPGPVAHEVHQAWAAAEVVRVVALVAEHAPVAEDAAAAVVDDKWT